MTTFQPKSQQEIVFENTKARGYLNGWSRDEFLFRQFAKLVEEVGELAQYMHLPPLLDGVMERSGELGRIIFDAKNPWHKLDPFNEENAEKALKELADCQVVLFNLASMLGVILGREVSSADLAVEKSNSDIKRGVRNGVNPV